MDNILHTKDVDAALENLSGLVLTPDTVAICDTGVEMYGIYKKANESRWDLLMTTFYLSRFVTEE